ncbi:RDD family protein [Streptomyces sp. TG1A-8]|uniref:RDD family protein n=1 Tax=Streptomyces sp. TG1A-8 TaxID=3051385 RepID=UPI00265BE6A6|nr:RDD family protein [Streptomyces sp. TG1A-8]MDO0927424.1 RDD family protein [Streptomyces sp. TG1A-8]
MGELVTGEAVVLELRPAKVPSRALAVLLDLLVAVFVYIGVTVALVASTSSLDEAAQAALSIAAFLLVLVGGPIAVETLSHGRSLGKAAVGLRVVRDDGGPIRFRHALVRGALGVVEILMTFGVVACVASLVSARGRRLGDVFAGTLVVRERIPAGQVGGLVPPPPPWLAGRFAELDLSAVPDGLWLAVRQYLMRMQQLDPQVSQGMAQQLAADLAARTGAPAPQGVHPAAFLAAVVHERQSREARQAFGGGAGWVPAGGVPSGFAPGAPGTPSAPDVTGGAMGVPGGGHPPPVPPVPQPPAAHGCPPRAPAGAREPARSGDTAARPAVPPRHRPPSDRPATGPRPGSGAGAGPGSRSTGFAPPA